MKDIVTEVAVEVVKRGTKSFLVSVGTTFVLGIVAKQLNDFLGDEENEQ